MLFEKSPESAWDRTYRGKNSSARLRWEWLACTLAVVIFMVFLQCYGVLRRLDTSIYDRLLQLQSQPAHPDIVIVGIDDASLQALGQWPWPREQHAAMLAQLAQAKPKAVALDVLFVDQGAKPESDEALAQALRLPGLGHVFLPITARTPVLAGRDVAWLEPLPMLASAVSGFGHINVTLDEDGIVRSMPVFADELQARWPSLSLQLFRQSGQLAYAPKNWAGVLDGQHNLLPFQSPIGRFHTVSFISVLRGEIPASVLADKLVLVGVTATGMGDQYPTPVSGQSASMPGVEIAATALEGLLTQRLISAIVAPATWVLDACFVLGWMLLLYRLGPRMSLLSLIAGMTLCLGVCATLLLAGQIWWPIANLLCGLLLGYVLWSWRRVTVMFVDLKFRALTLIQNVDRPVFPIALAKNYKSNEWQDIIHALDTGLHVAELSQKRVTDTLQALPEAILLTDANGNIEMANERAYSLLKIHILVSLNAFPLISGQSNIDAVSETDKSWRAFMTRVASTHGSGLEVMLAPDVYVLVRATAIRNLAAFTNNRQDDAWWIVMLVDVSKQKRLQRQRNDAMQLLWHDLRAPQSAILTLLNSSKGSSGLPTSEDRELHERIAAQVHTTLGLADDFVWQLTAEADTQDYREIDMAALIHEVIDRARPLAQEKKIILDFVSDQLFVNTSSDHNDPETGHPLFDELGLWLSVEPRLMDRALFNLIENAIKYSPNHTRIEISLNLRLREQSDIQARKSRRYAEIIIKDEGYGISAENLPRIFDPYTRFTSPAQESQPAIISPTGHGLGLRLVKTVIELHHGVIACESMPGHGTVFTIELPDEKNAY